MEGEPRNTRVVVCLILAMTLGARLLLWLEPGDGKSARDEVLAATGGTPIEEVTIAYVRPGDAPPPSDCTVLPGGDIDWQVRGSRVQLALVGNGASDLGDDQKASLLTALRSLSARPGHTPLRVRLAAQSDPTQDASLPDEARALRKWLLDKGFIGR